VNQEEYLRTFNAGEIWRSVYETKPGYVIRLNDTYELTVRKINVNNALRKVGFDASQVVKVKAI